MVQSFQALYFQDLEGLYHFYFLRKNKAEVLKVSIFAYDEEEHLRQEREESFEDGEMQGRQSGIEQMSELILRLNQSGRQEDILKMAADEQYRKQLLEEFHLG